MALSCKEIHEQITAFVDDRVDEKEYRHNVATHIDSCPSCREAYQQEVMTKMVVRQRFQQVGTPSDIRSSIEQSLENLNQQTIRTRSSYKGRSRRTSPQRSILFLLILVAGLGTYILLFKDSSPKKVVATEQTGTEKRTKPVSSPHKSTGPANAFNLAIDSYQQFASGTLNAEYQASDLTQLKSTFSQNGVPTITFSGLSLPLKGGSITKQNGVPLPQILYSDGTTYLYLLEASTTLLQEGKGIYITQDVSEKLSKEPIWMRVSSDVNLVMYKNGDAVDVVVANRTPVELKKLLGLAG